MNDTSILPTLFANFVIQLRADDPRVLYRYSAFNLQLYRILRFRSECIAIFQALKEEYSQ
jgi:hypothetical protein